MNEKKTPLWNRSILFWLPMILCCAGCERANVFNFRGPEFLKFFGWFALGMFVVAEIWRRLLIAGIPTPRPDTVSPLDPYEVAYLAGKGPLAVNAAVVALSHAGRANVTSGGEVKLLSKPEPRGAHPLEQAIVRACVKPEGTPLKEIRPQAKGWLEEAQANLEERGLVYPRERARAARLWPLLFALIVPITALIKMIVGLSRGRPVGFLVLGLIVTLIYALARFCRWPFRTPAANERLSSLRRDNAPLKSHPIEQSAAAAAALPMAIALFGLPVLQHTPHAALQKILVPRSAGDGSGDGCGGSCGSGCGGGGGCGGCGGD